MVATSGVTSSGKNKKQEVKGAADEVAVADRSDVRRRGSAEERRGSGEERRGSGEERRGSGEVRRGLGEELDLFPGDNVQVMGHPGGGRSLGMKGGGGRRAAEERRRSSTAFYMNSPILATDWQKNIYLATRDDHSRSHTPLTRGYYKRRWNKVYEMRRCERVILQLSVLAVTLALLALMVLLILKHYINLFQPSTASTPSLLNTTSMPTTPPHINTTRD